MPFQKFEICFFFSLKAYFVPNILRFLYFHFLLPVIEIVEEVNEETILKLIASSIV